jgi:hypothetical protein
LTSRPVRSPGAPAEVCHGLPGNGVAEHVARDALLTAGYRPEIHPEEVWNHLPNHAFQTVRNRLFPALKDEQKTLSIQQVVDGDFALGAIGLSWHK